MAESVIGVPSSTATLPLRKVVLGVESSDGMPGVLALGTEAVEPGVFPPPPWPCATVPMQRERRAGRRTRILDIMSVTPSSEDCTPNLVANLSQNCQQPRGLGSVRKRHPAWDLELTSVHVPVLAGRDLISCCGTAHLRENNSLGASFDEIYSRYCFVGVTGVSDGVRRRPVVADFEFLNWWLGGERGLKQRRLGRRIRW